MTTNFHNRILERKVLARLLESVKSELFIVYGRRGVGKSALLQYALHEAGVPIFYYRASRRTLSIQLATITELLKETFPFDFLGGSLSSMDEFFAFISGLSAKREAANNSDPIVVVLDELPYLAEVDEGLLTALQHWWDDNKRRTNIKLFLSGSHVSFMEREVLDVAAPLYNRRTGAMKLEPLDYFDAARFFPKYSDIDKIILYGILGGMPSYLEQFNPNNSIQKNVKEQVLRERTYLAEEPEWLLLEDLRKDITHGSILRAIAGGKRKPSDIARAIGKKSAQDVTARLLTLQELGLVVREVPITERNEPRSRSSLYYIADNYIDFWYRYVDPSKSLIARNMGEALWTKLVAPSLQEYISRPTFERVARQYLWRAMAAGTLPDGVEFVDVGNWWGAGDVEIDVVAVDAPGAVTAIGSCKWSKNPVGMDVYSDLREAAKKAGWNTESLHYFIFSKSGFAKSLVDLAGTQGRTALIGLPELFSFQ
jgi:uncharacterized protein